MYEIAQPRNLGDPEYSFKGRDMRRKVEYFDGIQEVRSAHSTEEAE
jgi:hypothetical protein